MRPVDRDDIAILNQQAPRYPPVVPLCSIRRDGAAAIEHPDIRLDGQRRTRVGADAGRDDDFNELPLDDGLRRRRVERAVEGDDAAERGGGVGGVRAIIGFERRRSLGHPARVGVLDDHAGRRIDKGLDAFQRGVSVGDIVERQLLALQLAGAGDAAGFRVRLGVEGGPLVRVLPVTHGLRPGETQQQAFRQRSLSAQIFGDRGVVPRRVPKGLGREREAGRIAQHPVIPTQLVQDSGVVRRIDDDADRGMILGGSAEQRGTADVDVLDRRVQVAIGARNRRLEGIQVNDDQVDRRDAVLCHDGFVQPAPAQDPAMDFRVQGLDPAIHHFRKARIVGNLGDGNAVIGEQARRAARRDHFDPQHVQIACEIDDTGFV